MDGVISDFEKERKNNPLSSVTPFIGRPDKIPNIYKDLEPIEGSIESVTKILKNENFETFFYRLLHGITPMHGLTNGDGFTNILESPLDINLY